MQGIIVDSNEDVPCGKSTCLMGRMHGSVKLLSDEVTALHSAMVTLKPDSWLERARNAMLTLMAVLVCVVSVMWLYDRLHH